MRHHPAERCHLAAWLVLALMLAFSPVAMADTEGRDQRWAQPVQLSNTKNLHQVTPGLYRSAQPTAQNFQQLEKMGIKTVINLRETNSDQKLINGTSLKLILVPIQTSAIGDEDVIAVLRHIKNEPGPVLVHCRHGADRTGTVIAMYRIIFEGWRPQEALDELRNGGYNYHSMFRNIPRYILNADIARIKAAVMAP